METWPDSSVELVYSEHKGGAIYTSKCPLNFHQCTDAVSSSSPLDLISLNLVTWVQKARDSFMRDILYNILFKLLVPMELVRFIKICLNET
jgi:hypothetical protein